MLTEHSSILCFLLLEVSEKCPKLLSKSMGLASRGLQDTHSRATEETAQALAGLVLIVCHNEVLPSMMCFVYMLQK